MKILVTGGAGYLGSVLVPRLLEDDCKVTVLDNFLYGQTPFGLSCCNPDLEIVNGDARDERLIQSFVAVVDVVIPLAAIVGAPACDKDVTAAYSTNVDAIKTLTRKMSVDQRILVPISNSGYGVGEPGKECTEETPLRPVSLYGRNKVEAEEIILDRGNAASFRLATVFGMSPRMRLDLLVNDFVWRAVHDKAVVLFEADFNRNYIHIQDVADTFVFGLNNLGRINGQVYNVGLSNSNLSKRELCEQIQFHIPDFVYMISEVGKDPDQRDYIVSNAKLEALGWRPNYSLDDGIRELIKGYRQFRRTAYGNV